jgi:hypothetical protein
MYLDKAVVEEETDESGADAAVPFDLSLHNISHDLFCSFASLVVVSVAECRGSRRSALCGC